VLEEMPPFPERESSILAKLKKKKPTAAEPTEVKEHKMPTPQLSANIADGPVQVGISLSFFGFL
jgi:AP-2 complex subunit alpha